MDQDAEISFQEDDCDGDKFFSFTGFNSSEIRDLSKKIDYLGGHILRETKWNDKCTHVISKTFEKSEIVLAGLAAGRWILNAHYIYASYGSKSWVRGRNYVHDECVIIHRKNRKRLGKDGLAFNNMKAMVIMDDEETKTVYRRIIAAGGGHCVNADLKEARERHYHGDNLTHIIVDPWVQEPTDWRNSEFQKWLDYERRVAEYGMNDKDGWRNGGMLFKIHYQFLIDKLLHPLNSKVKELKYNIWDPKIVKMAKEKRKRKAELKAKLSRDVKNDSDSDDDLLIIKERYQEREKRRQPGRLYYDKSKDRRRGETLIEKEARCRILTGQCKRKRHPSSDNLVENLGFMETSKKKNKKSGGSQIVADPEKHFVLGSDGIVYVDTDRLIGDHGFGPLESRQSQYINNLSQNIRNIESEHNRMFGPSAFRGGHGIRHVKVEHKFSIKQEALSSRKTMKNEEVIIDDSDSDIEEVPASSITEKLRHKEFTGEDDDITIVEDLPPGIVLMSENIKKELKLENKFDAKHYLELRSDSDDDVEIVDIEDRKPDLRELLKALGPMPEILIDSDDSDSELEHVSEQNSRKALDIIYVEDDPLPPRSRGTPAKVCEKSVNIQPITDADILDSVETNELVGEFKPTSDKQIDEENNSRIEHLRRHAIGEAEYESPMKPIDFGIHQHSANITKEKVPETKNLLRQEEYLDHRPLVRNSTSTGFVSPTNVCHDTLVPTLNRTLLDRQLDTYEFISISLVCSRSHLFYNKYSSEKSISISTLKPMPLPVLQEFSTEDETTATWSSSRRRRKAQKRDEGHDMMFSNASSQTEMLIRLKVLEIHTSITNYLQPEILNYIFKNYFKESKTVVRNAQNFLLRYFFLHYGEKGLHREHLSMLLLNSLRDVEDPSLFNSFDIKNSVDIRCVWIFFKRIVDSLLNDGSDDLLKVLMNLFQKDLEIWMKFKSSRGNTWPVLYYILGGTEFPSNSENIVPDLVKILVDSKSKKDPWYLRRFIAMIANVTALLDDKENEGVVSKGLKVSFAKATSRQFMETSLDTDTLYIELYLLQPNWFSYLVSKYIMQPKSKSSGSSLGDLVNSFKEMSIKGQDTRSLVIQKYFSFSYIHVLLRANWFYNQVPDKRPFVTFSNLKKLTAKTDKRDSKEVRFRNGVKVSVKNQLKDLKKMTKFATGVEGDLKNTSMKSLLFNMCGQFDLGWHPAIPE